MDAFPGGLPRLLDGFAPPSLSSSLSGLSSFDFFDRADLRAVDALAFGVLALGVLLEVDFLPLFVVGDWSSCSAAKSPSASSSAASSAA